MSLYLWIICFTLIGPLALSFDRKVAFYKSFRALLPAIATVGALFILWDLYFTGLGIWGFTPAYLQGVYIGNLPLEECLFFVVVPFACLFIHEVLKAYFPRYSGKNLAELFAISFAVASLLLAVNHYGKWYTFSACFLAFLLIIYFHFIRPAKWFRHFVLTYLVVLLPFLLVNGILTGAVTEKPVVWYNESHIMGWRIVTIPVEDLFYNFDLLLPVCAIFEYLKNKQSMTYK